MDSTTTLNHLKEQVKNFCDEHNLGGSPEHRTLDLVSEVGELSKELLKASCYGNKGAVSTTEIKNELGDVFFSLITLANSLNVDLETVLEQVLVKYKARAEKGGIGSENE